MRTESNNNNYNIDGFATTIWYNSSDCTENVSGSAARQTRGNGGGDDSYEIRDCTVFGVRLKRDGTIFKTPTLPSGSPPLTLQLRGSPGHTPCETEKRPKPLYDTRRIHRTPIEPEPRLTWYKAFFCFFYFFYFLFIKSPWSPRTAFTPR